MKKGQKLTRICADCKERKEQVKDRMMEGGGQWRCSKCIEKTWEKTKETLVKMLNGGLLIVE